MPNELEILMKEDDPPLAESLHSYLMLILNKLEIRDWEFSLTLTDDKEVAALNAQWRNKEGTTDVLTFVLDEEDSFPEEEGLHHPGDIVISLEQVERQAPEFDETREKELKRVCVHGILHLKGMTHTDNDWDQGMLKLQEELLKDTESVELRGWN